MKFNASTVLGGLLFAGSLAVAQAQTTTTTPPAIDSTPTQTAPRPGDPTATNSSDPTMTKREADAAYADAKRQCKTLGNQERAACMQQAHDDHKRWKDMYKDSRKDDIRNPSPVQELPQPSTR